MLAADTILEGSDGVPVPKISTSFPYSFVAIISLQLKKRQKTAVAIASLPSLSLVSFCGEWW
jgi:hypothetical protein